MALFTCISGGYAVVRYCQISECGDDDDLHRTRVKFEIEAKGQQKSVKYEVVNLSALRATQDGHMKRPPYNVPDFKQTENIDMKKTIFSVLSSMRMRDAQFF